MQQGILDTLHAGRTENSAVGCSTYFLLFELCEAIDAAGANANALFFIYLFLFLLVGGYSCADTRLPVLVLNIMKGTCAMDTAPTKFTLSRRRASS